MSEQLHAYEPMSLALRTLGDWLQGSVKKKSIFALHLQQQQLFYAWVSQLRWLSEWFCGDKISEIHCLDLLNQLGMIAWQRMKNR